MITTTYCTTVLLSKTLSKHDIFSWVFVARRADLRGGGSSSCLIEDVDGCGAGGRGEEVFLLPVLTCVVVGAAAAW